MGNNKNLGMGKQLYFTITFNYSHCHRLEAPFKKSCSELKQKLKYLRREASYAIFEQCIISSDFKSPCALDKIKILKRLREKRIKQLAMIIQDIIKIILKN